MVNPGDIGLLRPVGNERIFVPARRPVVGEKCLLYPILGGGRYAIPLDQVVPGSPYLLEPSSGGRIAVPLAGGAPTCPLVAASFTCTTARGPTADDTIITVTNTSTGNGGQPWALAGTTWKIYRDGILIADIPGIPEGWDTTIQGSGTFRITLELTNYCGNSGVAEQTVEISVVPFYTTIDLHNFRVDAWYYVLKSTTYGDNVGNSGGIPPSIPHLGVVEPTMDYFKLTYEDGGGGTYDIYFEITRLTATTMRVSATTIGEPVWSHRVYWKDGEIDFLAPQYNRNSFTVDIDI